MGCVLASLKSAGERGMIKSAGPLAFEPATRRLDEPSASFRSLLLVVMSPDFYALQYEYQGRYTSSPSLALS